MKRYSSTTKGSSRRIFRNKRLIGAVLTGALVLALVAVAPKLFGYIGSFVLYPVVEVEQWLAESGGAIPTYFRDRSELLAVERDLRQQLAEHAGAHLTAAALEEENAAFRNILGATVAPRIAAAVVGRPPALPYDVFLIDRGSADGVVADAPVYAAENRAIGFIASVYEHSALVVLITSPGYESTVYIYGPNIYTTAEGQGGGSLRVSVPQGIELSEGNLVTIPSLDTGVYGTLSVIDSEPSRPEQYGYVSVDEPLAGIRYVSVGSAPIAAMTFEEAKAAVESVRADLLTVPVPQGILIDTEDATSTATSTGETVESSL